MYQKLFNFKWYFNIVEQSATVNYKGKEATFNTKKICNSLGGNTCLHHLGILAKDAEELIKQFKQQFNVDTAQVRKLGNLG
ncbi:MAG: hypothetical protein ACTSQU_05415 [Promethearchaeota archaeon]